jgi:heme-degrading monooxygenase HmoA
VISRSWHGAVPSHLGDAFDQHFRSDVIAGIAARSGNLGVFVKRQVYGGYDHFFLISYWDTWDSIRAFAGDEPYVAVHYPDDERFGLIADPLVLHQRCGTIDPWFGQ